MKVLLDTHTFIWFSDDHPNLSKKAKEIIEDRNNSSYVSMISFWEIAIKLSLKRIDIKLPLKNIIRLTHENGFNILPLEIAHIIQVQTLPLHHRDPFDRILISQCLIENLTFITKDESILKYSIDVMW